MKVAESVVHKRTTGSRRRKDWWSLGLLASIMMGCSSMSSPQETPDRNQASRPTLQPYEITTNPVLLKSLPRNLFVDQKNFWTGPLHMNETQWQWAVPLVLIGGGLIAEDTRIESHAPKSPTTISRASTASNAGLALLVGAGGGFYLWGLHTGNDQKRETGLLAGEAAIDAFAETEVFKYAAGRDRPYVGDHQGRFFQGGDSFPSVHATVSFAIASVIAHEYPGPVTKLLVYGMAGGISAARFAGQKHFASDLVIGSALGWYTGRQVFRSQSRYSDAEVAKYGTFSKEEENEESEAVRLARKTGSSYVPLDSWAYPAIERLSSLGYVKASFLGSKPWTRIETASLTKEAQDSLRQEQGVSEEVSSIVVELQQEFAHELEVLEGKSATAVKVESLYTRNVSISGQPLNDSYHFGETIFNNFGRPYEKGFNSYDGFSGYGTAGPFSLYVRGEYQHAPSAPGYALAARQAIATADQNPLLPEVPVASVDQFTLLDTYAAATAAGWNLSFGKQSLWWGAADGGALMFSDNAEPIYMFRANKTFTELPGILGLLGTVKLDVFFGKLSGNQYPPRPMIHGERISFKTTPNWEFSFERTSELGGVGRALTPAAIFESYVGLKSSFEYPSNRDPGKRTLGFDFTYHVPYLRKSMIIYGDGLLPVSNPFNLDNSHDPLYDPARTAIRCGAYLPKLPRLPKLDIHLESVYTDPPTTRSILGDYIYWDGVYKDLYTNKNNLIGDWIGREGMGFQGWSNYWFTPRSSLQFNYRHAKIAKDFIAGGETVNDGSVKILWWFHRDLSLSAAVQYEKWLAPVLVPTAQTNWTSTVEVAFWPKFVLH